MMKVRIKGDAVTIEGYVNVVERDSDVLCDEKGSFIERIKQGAFMKSLRRRSKVAVLLNHDATREVANTSDGSASIREDNVGLYCRAKVTDKDVVEKARGGKLSGWSFGFISLRENRTNTEDDAVKHRDVIELDLREVSILDDTKVPAYPANSISTRDTEEGEMLEIRCNLDECDVRDENASPDGVADISQKGETGDPVESNYQYRNRLDRARIRK